MELVEAGRSDVACNMVRLLFSLIPSFYQGDITDTFVPRRAECDPANDGALTRDAFVRGMWRIDEELRRAQLGLTRVRTSARGPTRSKPRAILR